MAESTYLPALLSDIFGVSRSESRRTLAQGGVRVNGAVITDLDYDGVVTDLQMGSRHVQIEPIPLDHTEAGE